LPRSPLGKVLKSELGDVGAFLATARPVDGEQTFSTLGLLTVQIQKEVALCLQCEPGSLLPSASFQSMGFDSLRALELHLRLVKLTGLPLSISALWNHPSIDELAAALWARMNAKSEADSATNTEPVGISQTTTDLDEMISEVEKLSDSEIETSFRTW
jgi:hypothetical protein